MNQYAFNVFLEKHRESQIDEGILGVAAKTIMGGAKLAAGSAKQAIKSDITKKLASASQGLQKYGVNKAVAGDIMRGKNLGANIRTAVIQGAPAVGKKIGQKVMDKGREAIDFAKKGGFSKGFNDRFAGMHGGAMYGPFGQFGRPAGSEKEDPLAGLSPAERRQAKLQGYG